MKEIFSIQDYLNAEQTEIIQKAIDFKIPILIEGPHIPTGKSSLCELIEEMGGTAVEEWEILEGPKDRQRLIECNKNENKCHIVVTLNKPVAKY